MPAYKQNNWAWSKGATRYLPNRPSSDLWWKLNVLHASPFSRARGGWLGGQAVWRTEDFSVLLRRLPGCWWQLYQGCKEGFVCGKGLTVEDITFREIKGEEYVYVTKEEIAAPRDHPSDAVLQAWPSLSACTGPTTPFEYIRPVHTLTVL